MNKNSMPHADLALKIAKILHMSLESLLGDDAAVAGEGAPSQPELEKQELALYRKNKVLIDTLEEIPAAVRDSMQDLIIKTRDSYR